MTAPAVVEAIVHAPAGTSTGGQFVPNGGPAGGSGSTRKQAAKAKKAAGPPPGSMAYNRKKNRGTGYGIRGGDRRVRALQSALNRLGLTDMHGRPLAVDGKLGPKTTSSIKKLQQRLGLKADGIVTPAFLAQIRNLRAVPMPKKAGKAAVHHRATHHKSAPKKYTTTVREAAPAIQWWDIDPIGELDEATEALICALDQISPCKATEALSGAAFNDAHKRGSDGKFIKMIDRIIGAITDHQKNGGKGDPLKDFSRPQLRNAAKARGITLIRGESDDSIKRKLIADIGGGKKSAPAVQASPAKKVAKTGAKAGKVTASRALAAVPVGLHTEGAITRLTKDQRDFLRQYKGTAYGNINDALRREQGDLPSHGGFDFHREAVGHIDAAMARSKLRSDVVVHRGVKDGSAVFGPAWDHDLTGARWTEHAYVSTSADPNAALDFLDITPLSGATLRIRAPKGTPALALSGPDYESEILLRRGLRMQVLSDSGPGPNRVIEVGVVHDKPRGTAGAGDAGSAGSAAGSGAPGDGLSGGSDVPGQGEVGGAVATPQYAPQTAHRASALAARQQAAGMRAAGIKPGKPLPKPPAEVAAELGGATSREQAHKIISALSATELRALAREAGVTVASKANKTTLRNTIVSLLVGHRLDSHAIFSGR